MRRIPVGKVRAGIRMARVVWGTSVLFPLVLASCGPMSLEAAERQCFERARLAQQPRGEIYAGATSTGKSVAGLEVTVTSDFLLGKDPSAVYDNCVMSKAGELPSRPLYARPDWRG